MKRENSIHDMKAAERDRSLENTDREELLGELK